MDTAQFQKIRKTIPKRIDLDWCADENTIEMLVREPYQPLHSENAAFEAWILYIHKIDVKTKITLAISELTSIQYDNPHFKRFLYRLSNFVAMEYGWLSVEETLLRRAQKFMDDYISNLKIMRLPHSDTAGSRNKGERILQNQFSDEHSILRALPECDGSRINADFNIDLFWGKKRVDMRPENRVFPSGPNSKLDLWCVPSDTLSIFHLTYQERLASVVSELFFYANWCRDVFVCSEKYGVVFPRLPAKAYRGFEDFYDSDGNKKPLKGINACFLSDTYHQDLEFDFICEMLSTRLIHFQMMRYSCDMPLKFTEQTE